MKSLCAKMVGILIAMAILGAGTALAAPKELGKEKDKEKEKTPPAKDKEKADVKDMKDAPAAAPTGAVYRYLGNKKGNLSGMQVMSLTLEDIFTGKKETLFVPNNDPASKTYDPLSAVAAEVETLDVGAAVQVDTEKQKGRAVVTGIRKAEAKPGEELPNGFVFVESKEENKGGVPNVIVTLSKFGREIRAGIPMVKDDEYKDAKWEPDKKIDSVVRRLQAGTVVEALIRKQGKGLLLGEIYEYQPPERGKFVGTKETEFKGWRAAGFQILDEKGTTVTFTMDGVEQTKNNDTVFAPNPQQWRAVQKIKPDTEVEVRYRVDGGKWLMRDIKLLSDPGKTKPGKPAEGEKMKEEKEAGGEDKAGGEGKPKTAKPAKG